MSVRLSELVLPLTIERRQRLFFDGIRLSLEMMQISYTRLQSTVALEKSIERPALALLDAWVLVDTLNRLRVLIRAMPGLRAGSPGTQSIRRALAPIEELRNAVQHMYGEIERLHPMNQPLWGSLAWLQLGPADDRIRSRTLLPGIRLRDMDVPIIRPTGKQVESPAGPIELTAAGKTVSLSELVQASARFGDRLARATGLAIAKMPADGDDHRLVLDVQATEDP